MLIIRIEEFDCVCDKRCGSLLRGAREGVPDATVAGLEGRRRGELWLELSPVRCVKLWAKGLRIECPGAVETKRRWLYLVRWAFFTDTDRRCRDLDTWTAATASRIPSTPSSSALTSMSRSGSDSSPAGCPIDHSSPSGQVWNGLASKPDPKPDPLLPSSSSSPPAPAPPSHANSTRYAYLSTLRETSSIPRTANEKWVYPSEAQFYTAMLRKHGLQGSSSDGASHAETSTASNTQSSPSSLSPEVAPECPVPHAHPRAGLKKPNPFDMQVVVPIHNAVNERTWVEILKWEDYAPRSRNVQDPIMCPGGLRLVSFKGDASKLTPRARWRSLLGYVTLLTPFAFPPPVSLVNI